MIKKLTLSDKLIQMTIAYESADFDKAQELGSLISSTMHEEAGIMIKRPFYQPARIVITDRNGRFTVRQLRRSSKKVKKK